MKTLGPVTLATIAVALAPSAATAADVPAVAGPVASSSVGGVAYSGTNGGASYGEPVAPEGKPKKRRKRTPVASLPVLGLFGVGPSVLTPGQAPTVNFRVDGRAATIRVRLVVTWPGTTHPQRVIDLGRVPMNRQQTHDVAPLADPSLPEGQMSVRIAGRDSNGRVLRPGAKLSRVTQVQVRGHVFPLRGVFTYGSDGARFGAGRDGHTHQGQDLAAAEGTPVVAPRSGTVKYVEYQAKGAGWYVILDGDAEDLDYGFMHLQEGSIPVQKGEHVDQGQRLGSVGNTGRSFGAHLHFEIWQGAWYDGGKAIDPLPYLKQWETWSPVRAT